MKSDDHAQDELVAGNKNALSLSCELRRPVCGAPSLPPSLIASSMACCDIPGLGFGLYVLDEDCCLQLSPGLME